MYYNYIGYSFRATSLIAFLHNTSCLLQAKLFFTMWAQFVGVQQGWLQCGMSCRSSQDSASSSSQGQGLAAAVSGSSPSGKGQPWPPRRGDDVLRAPSHFTRKFSPLIKSQILSIRVQELIFQYQDNLLSSCPCSCPSLPPHCTVLDHSTLGQSL